MDIVYSLDIVEKLGKIAGIGGISLGVFLLLFKDVIRKNFVRNSKSIRPSESFGSS